MEVRVNVDVSNMALEMQKEIRGYVLSLVRQEIDLALRQRVSSDVSKWCSDNSKHIDRLVESGRKLVMQDVSRVTEYLTSHSLSGADDIARKIAERVVRSYYKTPSAKKRGRR